MTTIHDIADFARIIKEQPEWNDTIRAILLGQELLDLPYRFAEFVRVTDETNRLVAERLGRLEADMAILKTDMTDVKADVTVLKTDVFELKTDMAEVKTDVAELKTDMTKLQDWQGETTLRLDRIEGRLGNLEGAELERRVHSDIANIASRWLGLNRVRIMQSRIIPRSPEFQDIIDDAEEQNVITYKQGDELERTDILVEARRRDDRQQVHLAIEVSRSIADYDINRARERAQTLSQIFGTPTISVVVGGKIADSQQELADRLGVRAIIVPRLAE